MSEMENLQHIEHLYIAISLIFNCVSPFPLSRHQSLSVTLLTFWHTSAITSLDKGPTLIDVLSFTFLSGRCDCLCPCCWHLKMKVFFLLSFFTSFALSFLFSRFFFWAFSWFEFDVVVQIVTFQQCVPIFNHQSDVFKTCWQAIQQLDYEYIIVYV